MSKKNSRLLIGASICATIFLSNSVLAEGFKPSTAPLPISEMTRELDLQSARLSVDGKHVAALVYVPGANGPVVNVWETENLSKPPKVFGSKTMRFYGLSWAKNDKILLYANQPVVFGAKSDWSGTAAISNLDGSKIVELSNENAENTRDNNIVAGVSMFNSLPMDPDNVLLQISRFDGTEIVKVNLNTGQARKYLRSGENERFDWSDPNGVVRVKSDVYASGGVWYQRFQFRDNDGKWREMEGLKQKLNDRYTLDVQHVSNDGKTIYVITDKDTNYAVLKKFDVATQTFSDTIAQNTDYDLSSVSFGSADDEYHQKSDPIREICWNGPVQECQNNDETDNSIRELLENALPNTIINFNVKQNGNMVLVSSQAPNLPVTYYILKNKSELIKLGSNRNGWDQTNLAPAEWVVYPARDGLKIPGILYTPKGYNKEKDGRIPLVVLPHGGPWSRDYIDFDATFWPQMFATRGFAVLQPNYRGSEGLGKTLWKAGDKNWGLKMQDDNDDAAKWVVEQGIADPERMMIYGYSYGGFAAASAATRSSDLSKGIWQCAISGAPAIDLVRISNDWGASRLSRILQGETVAGLNPYDNLDKVKIPWLIVHGSYDHQADILHSTDTASKMKSVNPNADFRFVQIAKMSHTMNKWTPDNREQLIGEILNWTSNHCGNISKSFKEPQAEAIVKKYSK